MSLGASTIRSHEWRRRERERTATQLFEGGALVMLEEPGWLEDMQVLLPVPGWLEVVLVLLEVDGSPQWAAMPGSKVMP